MISKVSSIYSFSLLLLFTFSCSKQKPIESSILITYDDIAGFIPSETASLLITDLAHSGNTCTYVSRDLIYGATFKRKLSNISLHKINKIMLKAWVRKDTDNANLKIVCTINKGDSTLLWQGIETKSQHLVKGLWKEISLDIDISKFNAADNYLLVYPLNDGDDKILFDDLSITMN